MSRPEDEFKDDMLAGVIAAVDAASAAFINPRRPLKVHDRANEAKEDYLNTIPPQLYKLMKEDIVRVWSLLESPIEQVAIFYLASENYSRKEGWPIYAKVAKARGLHDHKNYPVQIIPQVTFGRHRVDFLIDLGTRGLVAIECDGEEFHQDKAKDRRRDDELREKHGVKVFRMAGKDIWRDNKAVQMWTDMVRLYLEWGTTNPGEKK
jgi:very-short-patch-repair endonuclease